MNDPRRCIATKPAAWTGPTARQWVTDSTPEPDGTSRTYWLRVPPTTRTAREGVSWTFGVTEADYEPLVQT